MQKAEYYRLVGKRLSEAMEQLGLNQQQVLLRCSEQGYALSQSALSKMLSGASVQTLQLVQVCKVLSLNPAEVLSLDPDTHIQVERQTQAKQIITDARNSVFRGYKGSYSAYFYTTKNEDYIHAGTFRLQEDPATHQCVVDFTFKTSEKDEDGKDIEKHYSGPASYSMSMQAIYCEICSEDIGEKCYLVFHYDFLAYQKLECRLVTVITVSCGVKRLPTMHKLLLSRRALELDDLEYLCGQLKLNSSEILMSENAYREFLRDPKLPEKFFEYFGDRQTHAEGFLSSVAKMPYISFNESLISDSFLPPLDKIKIICLLRKYSAAPRYNKISGKADEIIYNYLRLKQAENAASAESV